MKKILIFTVGATMLLSSCGSYAGSGAYTGAQFGSILGSAIGGISGGPRGSDIGTIVGMAGGAIVGGVIGEAADKKAKEEMYEHRERVKERRAADRRQMQQYDDNGYDSGFDETNSGDDRIYDFDGSDYTGNYTAQMPTETMPLQSGIDELASRMVYTPHIKISNARFVDDNQDGVISRGELCKVIFEVFNTGQSPIFDVQPTVIETTGNKHLYVSPSMHIERINPGKGVRYTAILKADNKLKSGSVKICCSVLQGDKAVSKVSEFNIPTRK